MIVIGSKVAYSKEFLQRTGQYAGTAPHARGVVTCINTLPRCDLEVAVIDWGKNSGELPDRVNVRNLVEVTKKGIIE